MQQPAFNDLVTHNVPGARRTLTQKLKDQLKDHNLKLHWETFLANVVTVFQEWMAVTFQLVCLSRLETTADIKSLLVLFLTLVVFTGPYLNAWLLFTDYICLKLLNESSFNYMKFETLVVGCFIAGAHVAGSATAYAIVKNFQPQSTSTITWDQSTTYIKNENWEIHLLEEMLAVLSLLIGCVYLLWLATLTKEKRPEHEKFTKMPIKFYFHLTILVAAVSQAFPSAQLSPHVLFYNLFMQRIAKEIFFARMGGGALALIITTIWYKIRLYYREKIQKKL